MMGKKPYRIPIIRIDPKTGEEVRFESIAEGARSVGVKPSQIYEAWLFEHLCRGFLWKREGE